MVRILALFSALVLARVPAAFCAEKAPVPTPIQPPASTAPTVKDDAQSDDDSAADDDDDDDDSGEQVDDQGDKAASADDQADDDDDDDDDVASEPADSVTGNVTLASDYILRGVSQTQNNPAVQGGFDWMPPLGIYLGVWGSNVHFDDSDATMELAAYGGYIYRPSPIWELSLGALYYAYFAGSGRDSWEIPLVATWSKKITLEVDYLPRWEGEDAQLWYFSGGWTDSFFWDVKLGARVGYSIYLGTAPFPNYVDVDLSVSREFFGLNFQVDGIVVNEQAVGDSPAGSRAVFSLSREF